MAAAKLKLVIKIGTAALGADSGMPDTGLIERLTGEITALKVAGHDIVLVSSGAAGTGRALTAKKKPLQHCDPAAERQILASLGQTKLMALYQDALTPHGLLAAQILLTHQDFQSRAHHKRIMHLFTALQKQPHILPVVNENDSIASEDSMFTDNDELAGLLAAMLKADRLIILSHVAGVYDRAPDAPNAAIIPLIDETEKIGVSATTRGKSKSGRGGMASKLSMAKRMARLGIRTHIAAAREPDILGRLLRDEAVGTAVMQQAGKRNAVKRWLASEVHAAQGAVTANACLADMMGKEGPAFSLLPVGLVKVTGAFGKGDMVRIVDESGKNLALGIARCDAAALRPMLGKKNQPVFVHYDQLHRMKGD